MQTYHPYRNQPMQKYQPNSNQYTNILHIVPPTHTAYVNFKFLLKNSSLNVRYYLDAVKEYKPKILNQLNPVVTKEFP